MKKNLLSLVLFLALSCTAGWSQDKPTATTPAELSEATMINSDRLQLDITQQMGTFIGNVQVSNPRFELKAKEVIVYFSGDNKPQRFVAKGDVAIKHGDRTTTSRQAEYNVEDKKIILTGDPVVMQNQNRVTGNIITIFPEEDRMDVQGRTTVHLLPN